MRRARSPVAVVSLLIVACASALSAEHREKPAPKPRTRGERVLFDTTLFKPGYGEQMLGFLKIILDSRLVGQTAGNDFFRSHDRKLTMADIEKGHGQPDHKETSEGLTCHYYDRVCFLVRAADKAREVILVQVQYKDHSQRAARLNGPTYDYVVDEDEGAYSRVYYQDNKATARERWAKGGPWKLVSGRIPNGQYRRHWSAADDSLWIVRDGQGVEKHFHPYGQLRKVAPFRDGNWNGVARFYSQDGTLESEGPLRNGKLHGVSKLYWKTGQLQQTVPYQNGLREGPNLQYYRSGRLWFEIPYEADQAHGLVKEFYESGRLRRLQRIEKGKKAGALTYHDPHGNQVKPPDTHLHEGGPDGTARLFWPNGKLRQEIRYRDGLRDGITREYHPSGKLRREAPYRQDTLHGTLKEYGKSGHLIRQDTYEYGKRTAPRAHRGLGASPLGRNQSRKEAGGRRQ